MPTLPWRKKQLSESGSRCSECATRHVVFVEKSDYGVVVPASEQERFCCVKCGAELFELDVKDGTSVFVFGEDDPLVEKMRRQVSPSKTTFKRVDWEHPYREFLTLYVVVVLLLACVALILWLWSC
jgi:hypothetical protein